MRMQVRFGAHDGPICPACNRQMNVTRRTPHPLHGHTYELQTFECRKCWYEIKRSADRAGLPHVSDALPSITQP
jgi:C4-type Zn-finger protein